MSKETFSKKISEIMNEKMLYLENLAYDVFFKKDDYFELVLCLSYMTLSKEKIIKKDMKNTNRLDRLTRLVQETDIDKVFTPGFSKEMPNIIHAKESNNTWILDNIRDSIMHGAFDIDEEKECFIINNNQYDRELIAEIPFSWFIAYAKYDILSKKITDNYTIKGFYYNTNKKDKTYLNTKKEIMNNILYNIKITGTTFNIKTIEKRIKEILEECSKTDIPDSLIKKYKSKIDLEKIKYNEKYLTSFYIASEVVKEKIEKEFPGTNLSIYIDNRKYNLVNKLSKKMPSYYKNYQIMYKDLNNIISNKSTSLLKYISRIIENLDNIPKDYSNLNYYEIMDMFNYILQGEKIEYTNQYDIFNSFNNNLNLLREICLNVYGLSTLVINQENLYNNYFLKENPSDYQLISYSKQKYLDYANNAKSHVIKILEKEIKLFDKNKQLEKCTVQVGKQHLTKEINDINEEIKQLKIDLNNLSTKLDYKPYIIYNQIDKTKMKKMQQQLDEYYNHFDKATTVKGKQKIKKVISKFLSQKIEEESKYTYGYCNTMQETLTIIRNCFSHIGRTHIKKNSNQNISCFLTDYDNNNTQSGAVIGDYHDLINVLSTPFYIEKNVKHK